MNCLKQTTLIRYNKDEYSTSTVANSELLVPIQHKDYVQWFNTYGKVSEKCISEIVVQNKLDDFVIKVLFDKYTNKVIELDNILFVSIEVFMMQEQYFNTEKIAFILNPNFVWSIQDKVGNYFEWIRNKLHDNRGLVRNKKADYLFFLILDTIIDNYEQTFAKISVYNDKLFSNSEIKPTPEFTAIVEERKQELFKLKKTTKALQDTLIKLHKTHLSDFKKQYFEELSEQINSLMSDVDFALKELESKINLILSIQGHRLNEIMKTLTIFSIIFTPITFIAGLYGMNFRNMPELYWHYGYFITLGVMLFISVVIIWYFKRKKWF